MIRKIEKPEIDFKFCVKPNFKYYYNEENGEYFLETKYKSKFYFNLKGNIHRIGKHAIEYSNKEKIWVENGKWNRLDGPASCFISRKDYFINDRCYSEKKFAKETNHLICENCRKFCKQGCFF